VNLSSYPSIATELAAERHSRFMAEADHARRLAQLHRGRGLETAAARFMRAVRASRLTQAAQVETWGARRRLHQWSRLSQA
jgi:hypothetical protein